MTDPHHLARFQRGHTCRLLSLLVITLLSETHCARPVLKSQRSSCSPIESQFDAPDIKLCKQLLNRFTEPGATSCSKGACCQEAERFKQARCHCWSGFTDSDLRPAEDLQSRCTGSGVPADDTAAAASAADPATGVASEAATQSTEPHATLLGRFLPMLGRGGSQTSEGDMLERGGSQTTEGNMPGRGGSQTSQGTMLGRADFQTREGDVLGREGSQATEGITLERGGSQAADVNMLGRGGSRAAEGDEPGEEGAIRLFVGVLTSGQNAEARAAVRSSWGKNPRLHRVMFFAAKPREPQVFELLRKEAAAEGDIVMLPDVWEGYHNITHQTLEVCRAAALHPQATHTMKVDDDAYVRVERLLKRLEAAPRQRMFTGAIEDPGGGPNREVGHQWYVSEEDWPSDTYPPWAHGVGYVLTQDLVREIAAGAAMAALDHKMLRLEDVAMGAWIQFVGQDKGWQVALRHDRGFNFGGCRGGDVVSHYITPKAMTCMAKQRREQCCTQAGEPRGARVSRFSEG